jgi:class 3 adenylate cyclase/tetratricopeptide (TPR) repeat protein
MTGDLTEQLAPYLPRLALEWAATAPGRRHQAIDGSLLFVDISGFTKMSERLARHGKVGAEEVTDAIGTCFEAVLAVAYAGGGGLLKFGGDALLLLFRDADHAPRAAEAAIGMQRRLAEVGRLDTTAGRVVLRMSAGVHSGTIHCFMAGTSHRELVLAGRDVSTTVAMEGTASAGQIVASPALVAQLRPALVGPTAAPGVRLRRVALPEPGPVVVTPVAMDGADVRELVPRAIRAHLLEAGAGAQHRQATVAFCHFDGTDDLLDREGPGAVADALDQLIEDVQRAADDHGVTFLGTDIDHDGGKVILVAGAPRASDGDEERMLGALRRISDGERRLPVRIGVHRGPIFAGDVGPPYRRTYTVMGDTVNLAARLMARAEPGQIVATPSVLDRSRTQFELEALPPFTVKGKRHPVHAFSVGALRRREQRTATTLPLVGRDDEMHVIERAVAAVRAGDGRVVEIVGEAGIGKSRLADELLRTAEGLPTLRLICDPYEANTPYAPFWWLLHDLLGVDAAAPRADVEAALVARVQTATPDLLPWLPLLGSVLDLELAPTPETAALQPEFRRDRLDATLAAFLAGTLPDPVVVVLEDTQHLDAASRAVVGLIVDGIANRAALLCITRREPSATFSRTELAHARVLQPAPLSLDQSVAALADATRDAPLRPHELSALADRAAGNPLFLAELLRSAQDAGGVDALPDSIDAVINAQIDGLPPDQRRLLRDAAVLGRTFQLTDLAALVDDDLAVAALARGRDIDELLDLSAPGQATFRSAVVRDTAYETLPFRRRRELHGRAGDALLAELADHPETEAELLSMHFFHAQRYPEAWRFARLAGDRAAERYANVDAVELFQRALHTARRLPTLTAEEIASVWERLGEVRDRAGLSNDALAAYRAARKLRAGDPVAEARLLLRESEVADRSQSSSQGIRVANRALRLVDAAPGDEARRLQAQLLAWLATMRQAQGHGRAAIALGLEAVARAAAAGDLEAEGQARLALDWAYWESGQGALATHSERALEIYEQLGDLGKQAAILNNLGGIAYYAGRWDDALTLYERARVLLERAGDSLGTALGAINAAEVLMNRGQLDRAETLLVGALQVFRASHDVGMIAQTRMYLGRVLFLQGRFAEARDRLDEAREGFAQYVGSGSEVNAQMAECHLRAGEIATALALAETTLERARAADEVLLVPSLERVRGLALAGLGQLTEARAAVTAALGAARAVESPFDVALALEALVEIDTRLDLATAEDHGRECRELFAALGVRREPTTLDRSRPAATAS